MPEHFESLEQAGDFWDTHDSADYEEFMTDVEPVVNVEKLPPSADAERVRE